MTLLPLTILLACIGKSVDEDDDDGGLAIDDTGEVTAVNNDPVAEDDVTVTWPWRQTQVDVLSNDIDSNGDSLGISEVSESEHGSVTIYDSTIMLTQTDKFIGEEVLTYTADDGNGGTDTASLTVTFIEQPMLIITGPDDGAVVDTEDVDITFEVTGCTVSTPSDNPAGCHLHKLLDDANYSDTDGTGYGHYDEGGFIISPISEGEHTFTLYLIANDGSDAPFTPLISDTITLTVELPEEPDSGQ